MSYRVDTSAEFDRRAGVFFRKHRDLEGRFERLVDDLRRDPFQPRLRLHRLQGKYLGQHAVSLTRAYRVTLTLLITERHILLLDIGTHDEVYR